MATPLLQTKLYIPPLRPELVPRSRLIERLNAGTRSGRKLTLISAPAGFGKTTLISEWVHALGKAALPNAVAWLSLDESDNDLTRFLTYLIAALQTIESDVGKGALIALQSPQPPSTEAILIPLINEAAAISDRIVLILDDYHLIEAQAIHDALTFLLRRLPPQMHLVIATREDPPLSLARLRARSQLTELRATDLRFTSSEAAEFLNQVMGLDLSAEDIAALETRTEGWIAGLQMAAFALQAQVSGGGAENVSQFVSRFSGRHHFILDYLTDEVLDRQPKPLYRFLLRTSILERMCGPLCDVLTGSAEGENLLASGQQILEQLQHANLFVMPLDDERQWYRYHRFFAELLRARLQRTAPDLVPGLHLRAAKWYDQNAFPTEAVHHARAVPDFDLVAEIIERAIPRATTWSSVDVATLQEWLSILPDDVMRTRPLLWLVASRVFYLIGRRQDTERILKQVEAMLEDDPAIPDAGNILGMVLADRASYAAVRGDVRQAIAFAQRALTHLPENEATTRMRVSAILGLAHYRAGDTSQAGQAFLQSIAAAKTVGLEFATMHIVCNLAQVRIVQGQLDLAIEICQHALDMAVVDGVQTSMAGLVELELGRILYARNDLSAAERHVSQGLALLEKSQMTDSFGLGYALLAQIRQAQGESDGARVAIQRAVQIAQTFDIARISALIGAYQARIWLAQDKPDLAVRWARDYEQRDRVEYLREFQDLTLARVFLAKDQPSRALALLDGLLSPAETAGRMGTVIEISALRALALQALGEGDQAFQALKRALQLAQHERHTRVFLGEGKPMARLLYAALARKIVPDYARRLLAAFPIAEPEQASPLDMQTPESDLIEPLSEREVQVLELVAQGLTNPEIASRLVLSLHTIKTHARSIYGKLGVHNRTEAVARARALGVLPST